MTLDKLREESTKTVGGGGLKRWEWIRIKEAEDLRKVLLLLHASDNPRGVGGVAKETSGINIPRPVPYLADVFQNPRAYIVWNYFAAAFWLMLFTPDSRSCPRPSSRFHTTWRGDLIVTWCEFWFRLLHGVDFDFEILRILKLYYAVRREYYYGSG